MWGTWLVVIFLLVNTRVDNSESKPSVDPGLFMILGVESCRNGDGYCLLGLDCTLDDDFLPDDTNGHCNGLKNAFTPSAHFTCCKYNQARENATTTKRPRPGLIKPTIVVTSAPETSTETTLPPSAATTIISVNGNSTAGLSVTENSSANATETTTLADQTESSATENYGTTLSLSDSVGDVFIDVNNEVFKEVQPPVLSPNNDTESKKT